MTDTNSAGNDAIELTSDEFEVVSAFRRAGRVSAATDRLGISDVEVRTALASAAEKLRAASISPQRDDDEPSSFTVPDREPCPFCRNMDGVPSPRAGAPAVVYEDELVYVFLAPRASGGMPGHTLVITRRHAETILDLTAEEAAHLGVAVASAARMVSRALSPAGILIQQNNGIAAFQTVPHIHFHVIPKRPGLFPPATAIEFPEDDRRRLAEDLRRHWEFSP